MFVFFFCPVCVEATVLPLLLMHNSALQGFSLETIIWNQFRSYPYRCLFIALSHQDLPLDILARFLLTVRQLIQMSSIKSNSWRLSPLAMLVWHQRNCTMSTPTPTCFFLLFFSGSSLPLHSLQALISTLWYSKYNLIRNRQMLGVKAKVSAAFKK